MGGDAHASGPAAKETAPTGVPLDAQLGFCLGRAHRRVRSAWEEVLAPLGVSAPQAAVVRAVGELGAPGLRALARRLHSDPMNVRRLVEHLERAGLVHSVADPDHRQRRAVTLTPAGAALGEALAGAALAFETRLAARVEPGDLEQLLALLGRLESALEAAGAPGRTHLEGPAAGAGR